MLSSLVLLLLLVSDVTLLLSDVSEPLSLVSTGDGMLSGLGFCVGSDDVTGFVLVSFRQKRYYVRLSVYH